LLFFYFFLCVENCHVDFEKLKKATISGEQNNVKKGMKNDNQNLKKRIIMHVLKQGEIAEFQCSRQSLLAKYEKSLQLSVLNVQLSNATLIGDEIAQLHVYKVNFLGSSVAFRGAKGDFKLHFAAFAENDRVHVLPYAAFVENATVNVLHTSYVVVFCFDMFLFLFC
jgi:hypothetical protein